MRMWMTPDSSLVRNLKLLNWTSAFNSWASTIRCSHCSVWLIRSNKQYWQKLASAKTESISSPRHSSIGTSVEILPRCFVVIWTCQNWTRFRLLRNYSVLSMDLYLCRYLMFLRWILCQSHCVLFNFYLLLCVLFVRFYIKYISSWE